MLDLAMLGDDEKNKLLEALIEERKGGYSADTSELQEGISYIAQRLDHLEKVVMDDLIGGIDELYQGNLRKSEIEKLIEAHSGDLDGYKDKYKSMFEGVTGGDLYGDLLDTLQDEEGEWDGGEDNPYNRDIRIPELIQTIKEKFGDIGEIPGVESIAAKVEVGDEDEEDPAEKLKNRIKQMSKKEKLY